MMFMAYTIIFLTLGNAGLGFGKWVGYHRHRIMGWEVVLRTTMKCNWTRSSSGERVEEVADGMISVCAHGSAFLDAVEDQWFPGVEPLLEPMCCGFFLEVFIGIAVEYVSVTGLNQRAFRVDFFGFLLSLGIMVASIPWRSSFLASQLE